jgi:hypothetical protein
MSVLDMPPALIALSFVITWGLGLSPALVTRYLVFKAPLARRKANWIAGISSVGFWLLFLFLNVAAGEQRVGNGLVWFVIFFVSRWIMTRGHPDYQSNGSATRKRRQGLEESLRELIADPESSEADRQGAMARLKALGHDL